MKILNDLFNSSCRPGYKEYKLLGDDIVLIDNFFENFEDSKNFFTKREVWKCIPYQNHSKQGCESVFPSWVGQSLLEKYLIDNKRNFISSSSFNIMTNFFFDYPNEIVWSLTNSGYFPHIDEIQIENYLQYICLVNIQDIEVSTRFYKFRNKHLCQNEKEMKDFDEYYFKIIQDVRNYFGVEYVTREQLKSYIDDNKPFEFEIYNDVKYKPNQAIIYPANMFHSPNMDTGFDELNCRKLLKISFYREFCN